jgi:hypothetical protein
VTILSRIILEPERRASPLQRTWTWRFAFCGNRNCFPNGVRIKLRSFFGWPRRTVSYSTAIFRQIDRQSPRTHHDAVEFADGHTVLLTNLPKGQLAAVLQLPAEPVTPIEAEAQKRAAYFG